MSWKLIEGETELCEVSALKRERSTDSDGGSDRLQFQLPAIVTVDLDQKHRLANDELGAEMAIEIDQAVRSYPDPVRVTAYVKRG